MEGVALGVVIGLGLCALRRVVRPVAKGVIKAGLTTVEVAREAIHEGGESLSDLVAEARQEVDVARQAAAVAGAARHDGGTPEPSGSN